MKRRWVVWLSVWLSLGSLVSACGTGEFESTTLETAAAVPAEPGDPTAGISERIAAENEAELQKFLREHKAEADKKDRQAALERRKALEAVRVSRSQQRASQTTTAPPQEVSEPATGVCGGSLPPCWVMRKESGGDIRIWNGRCYAPVGWTGRSPCGTSSASGKWQITRGTWNGFCWGENEDGSPRCYLNAADAPEAAQDAKARALWAGGKGCSHWNAC